ncbi:hypothetical protein [Bosea sp. (in: a-proteobacteria)]|uniref:hypothetical protein n=1 Tax=Bosea sp. (in: a-proteobacteria) TaxID=1871050 RepID=UPI001AD1A706|nr:hypothetical protein [Bosea sp. (in: a-proteobacteria)]MBN9437563.1 hypothetical protein [Bosea sp. (in: a-proteobacteria)]
MKGLVPAIEQLYERYPTAAQLISTSAPRVDYGIVREISRRVPTVFEATVSVVCERSEGLPATNDYQRSLVTSFTSQLVEREFNVHVFDPAGQDTIGGGCGQLWFVQQ